MKTGGFGFRGSHWFPVAEAEIDVPENFAHGNLIDARLFFRTVKTVARFAGIEEGGQKQNYQPTSAPFLPEHGIATQLVNQYITYMHRLPAVKQERSK
jgi:hypothetical protein